MSILQEYEELKKLFGEAKLHQFEMFLNLHPEYHLSDIYYNEAIYKDFEKWVKEAGLK